MRTSRSIGGDTRTWRGSRSAGERSGAIVCSVRQVCLQAPSFSYGEDRPRITSAKRERVSPSSSCGATRGTISHPTEAASKVFRQSRSIPWIELCPLLAMNRPPWISMPTWLGRCAKSSLYLRSGWNLYSEDKSISGYRAAQRCANLDSSFDWDIKF
jgi:hypothetical protein